MEPEVEAKNPRVRKRKHESSVVYNGYDAKFTTHIFREFFAPAEPIFH